MPQWGKGVQRGLDQQQAPSRGWGPPGAGGRGGGRSTDTTTHTSVSFSSKSVFHFGLDVSMVPDPVGLLGSRGRPLARAVRPPALRVARAVPRALPPGRLTWPPRRQARLPRPRRLPSPQVVADAFSSDIIARPCGYTEFYAVGDTECQECPTGAVCTGGVGGPPGASGGGRAGRSWGRGWRGVHRVFYSRAQKKDKREQHKGSPRC